MEKFYSKPYFMSYSALNKLLYSPSLFYNHYILQEREERKESYLIEGKIVHCLLLDNASFNEQFILSPASLPGDNTKLVVDRVYADALTGTEVKELSDYSDKIIEILAEIKLHQSLKTDQQRVDKIVTEEAKSYWEFIKIKGNKDIVDLETYNRCKEVADVMRNHAEVANLLGLNAHETDNVEIFNEQYVENLYLAAYPKTKFGIKGVLDNVKIDHDNKILYINDVKTTNKTIAEFRESVEVFNYWAQAAIYVRLMSTAKEDYKTLFNFVVVDKYNQIYVFRVSDETMSEWQDRLSTAFAKADWHLDNRRFDLPYDFATGVVIL